MTTKKSAKPAASLAGNQTETPFAVNQWVTHPTAGNDDCVTGVDYATLAEAEAALELGVDECYIGYLELDGPGVHRIVRNRGYNAKRAAADSAADDAAARREYATQAGMAFGCAGYNDAMGY